MDIKVPTRLRLGFPPSSQRTERRGSALKRLTGESTNQKAGDTHGIRMCKYVRGTLGGAQWQVLMRVTHFYSVCVCV